MYLKRLLRQLKLVAWQHKRKLVIAAMFGVAVFASLLLVMPGGSSLLAFAQWPTEFWVAAVVGVVICVGAVIWMD